MEKSKKIMAAIAGLAVVCIILTCGCTTQSSTTESTGSSVVPSYSEEIPVDTPLDTPVDTPAEMPADEAGTGASPQGSMPPGDLSGMTTEEIQEMLDMMQADGIDTTEAQEALADGDLDAVMAFMEENQPANGGSGTQLNSPPPQQ